LEGVLYFKGHRVYTRDPSGSIFQGLQLDQFDCRGPEDKPSNILELVALLAPVEAAPRPVGVEYSSIQLCGNSIGFHSLDLSIYIDRVDLQGLLVVAVDSVALEASIHQAGSLIRIASNSCIGILHAALWFSYRRFHSTGWLSVATG